MASVAVSSPYIQQVMEESTSELKIHKILCEKYSTKYADTNRKDISQGSSDDLPNPSQEEATSDDDLISQVSAFREALTSTISDDHHTVQRATGNDDLASQEVQRNDDIADQDVPRNDDLTDKEVTGNDDLADKEVTGNDDLTNKEVTGNDDRTDKEVKGNDDLTDKEVTGNDDLVSHGGADYIRRFRNAMASNKMPSYPCQELTETLRLRLHNLEYQPYSKTYFSTLNDMMEGTGPRTDETIASKAADQTSPPRPNQSHVNTKRANATIAKQVQDATFAKREQDAIFAKQEQDATFADMELADATLVDMEIANSTVTLTELANITIADISTLDHMVAKQRWKNFKKMKSRFQILSTTLAPGITRIIETKEHVDINNETDDIDKDSLSNEAVLLVEVDVATVESKSDFITESKKKKESGGEGKKVWKNIKRAMTCSCIRSQTSQ